MALRCALLFVWLCVQQHVALSLTLKVHTKNYWSTTRRRIVHMTASSSNKWSVSHVPAPQVPVAINGGDPWVGWRVTDSELGELCEAAMSTVKPKPVMKQFHPRRGWLWRQWHGTIVRSVLQNEVKLNMAWAVLVVSLVTFAGGESLLSGLKPMENFFPMGQTLVAFVLSFFLSQTYAVWRSVYSIARRVQGRLSDLGLILSTFAERDWTTGTFTPRAQATIDTWARYARLFTMLYFASVTTRFAPLATPKGLRALQQQGAITADEAAMLITTTSWHQTVVAWMGNLITQSANEGAMTGGTSLSYQASIKLTNLRAVYAQMSDELSGRMPLAYTHLVQLLVDVLCLAAPLALIGPLGPVGAVAGTGFVTMFYAGVLALAKMFLDPFDNEDYGGRSGIRLEADTLIQEVNALTRRWSTCATSLPGAVIEPRLSDNSRATLPPPALEDDDTDLHLTTSSFLDDDFFDCGSQGDDTLNTSVNATKPLVTRKILVQRPNINLRVLNTRHSKQQPATRVADSTLSNVTSVDTATSSDAKTGR